jgi:hypothetical protein
LVDESIGQRNKMTATTLVALASTVSASWVRLQLIDSSLRHNTIRGGKQCPSQKSQPKFSFHRYGGAALAYRGSPLKTSPLLVRSHIEYNGVYGYG